MPRTASLSILLIALAAPMLANDVIYLGGRVRLEGGAEPGHSVEIQLSCPGADHPIRQVVTNKKGTYFLKVERDEFNHVARALPATAMDVQNDINAGACKVIGGLQGYTSSAIDLASFTIGKDLKLPDLILTKQPTP
jgi:hypothetical protein